MSFAETAKQHPEFIAFAILLVIVLAYFASRGSAAAPSTEETFTGGGVVARPTDPGAVALEQARIQAASQNFSALSQLEGYEFGTSAQERVQEAQIASQVSLATISSQAATTAAGITADTQKYIAQQNAQAEAARLASQQAVAEGQQATSRDIARVQAKASVWGQVIGVAGNIIGGEIKGVGKLFGF